MMSGSHHPKRRLLFLLPFPPSLEASHGGGRVIAQLIHRLAARHRSAVLYLRSPSQVFADSMLQSRCDLVEAVTRPNPGFCLTNGWSRIGALARGYPMWAVGCSVHAFGVKARALVRTWRPDIIQVEYPVMAQYLPALRGYPAPRVLTEHDPGTKAARDLLEGCRGVCRIGRRIDWMAWRRFERRVIEQVQAVVVFTRPDQHELERLGASTPIIRIPFGVMLPAQALNPLGCEPSSLLFVGSFRHPPNIDAAIRLITSIFPKVQAICPKAVLYIVGDEPTSEMKRLSNGNVIVTGRVPDVSRYLDRAGVVVAPLRCGGGMRVKVLEALAAGKALVASSLAVEGLDVVDGEQVMIAESDEKFAEIIARLLTDPVRRGALAKRARSWACSHLDWESAIASYEALYESLLERSGNAPAIRQDGQAQPPLSSCRPNVPAARLA